MPRVPTLFGWIVLGLLATAAGAWAGADCNTSANCPPANFYTPPARPFYCPPNYPFSPPNYPFAPPATQFYAPPSYPFYSPPCQPFYSPPRDCCPTPRH